MLIRNNKTVISLAPKLNQRRATGVAARTQTCPILRLHRERELNEETDL